MQLHFKTRNCNLFKAQPIEEQAYIDSNIYFTSWVVCSPSMTGVTHSVFRYDIKKKNGVEPGNETRRVEPGNETRRAEPGNETRRAEPGNETRRAEPGNETGESGAWE